MKDLLTTILNTCFLNCSCMSTSVICNKLKVLTSNKYEVECVKDSNNIMAFKISNGVTITFTTNERHVIKNIECENTKKRINLIQLNGEQITETRRTGS